MRGKTYITIGLTLTICLFILNMNRVNRDNREAKEISIYEYTELETAMSLYPEVAKAVKENSRGEIVTASEYKKIMRQAGGIRQSAPISNKGNPYHGPKGIPVY